MGLKTTIATTAFLTILIIIILFEAYTAIVPEVQTSANSLNTSNRCEAVGCVFGTDTNGTLDVCGNNASLEAGFCADATNSIPLGNIFSGSGFVFILIMMGLLIFIIREVLSKK